MREKMNSSVRYLRGLVLMTSKSYMKQRMYCS